ncbi:hypothetical protein AB0933_32635 [Streptomyces venezuelae]|uniref:hypothetical protein n=1 Tax=Streptomyces venezuelae TaxID=54571 RepID=UPI0034516885
MLSDTDCCCGDYCTHQMPRMHALKQMSNTKAAMDGKLPCLVCVPHDLRAMPDTVTFGHQPVDEYQDSPEGKRGATHIVCARCVTWTHWRDIDLSVGFRVPWPCTSAVVLGISPRPASHAT